jgi:GNAT superfamily N-acetyltransferase
MTIRKLRRANAGDWFDFFDNRAFADHPDWKGCYCAGPFTPRLREFTQKTRRRRDYTEWLIETGRMRGYMAYEDGRVVGWCNVNLRNAFPKYKGLSKRGRGILAVACFIVEKEYRRRGVATRLLKRIIADAKKSGIQAIEAYPRKKAVTEFGRFLGPYSMFEAHGFRDEVVDGRNVVRRYLDRERPS